MQEIKSISGQKVCLYQMNKENRDKYLNIYRTASSFSQLYDSSEKLWKNMSEAIGSKEDETVRYIICIAESEEICGFINYDMEKGIPVIDIAIAQEYRQHGFGYDAAKALCEYLLSQGEIKLIYWFAMPNNKASIRIAEKLGGQRTDERNILAEAMASAFGKDVSEYKDLPATASFIIR